MDVSTQIGSASVFMVSLELTAHLWNVQEATHGPTCRKILQASILRTRWPNVRTADYAIGILGNVHASTDASKALPVSVKRAPQVAIFMERAFQWSN